MSSKLPISVVIITMNEEKNLRKLLPTLTFANEIIVVDSGSKDQTKAVCESFGCRFIENAFNGYGPQKIFAVNQAANDWVFSLDADEIPSVELISSLVTLFSSPPEFDSYKVLRQDVFLGRQMRGLYKQGHEILRLFRKSRMTFTSVQVHEEVDFHGKSGQLTGMLLHYSYPNMHTYFDKFNNYTSRSADSMKLNGHVSSLWILVKIIVKFFSFYIIQGNFLNGYPGFVWSFFSSWYVGIKLMKYNERIDNQN